MKREIDTRPYREEEWAVPDKIIGAVLLSLIKLLGYKLMVRWSSKPGEPQYCQFDIDDK